MIHIFVKVDGSKVTPMEVSPTDDKVEDVTRQIQKDEDVYVTMQEQDAGGEETSQEPGIGEQ